MKIKEYIETRKMSQGDFARLVGCTDGALSLWISEKHYPSGKYAAKIVKVTRGRVKLSDIYGEP